MCITVGSIAGAALVGAKVGTDLYSAKKSADTAKAAAKTQTDAAEKALKLQQDRYAEARQDFNPYQQAGATSLGRLGGMAGAQRQQFNPSQPGGGFQGPPQAGTQTAGGPMMPQGSPMGGQPPMSPQGPPQGGMVMMELNGQRGPVPAHLVPQLTQRGGRVINAG